MFSPVVLDATPQRSWSETLHRSKDESEAQVAARESRLKDTLQDLDSTKRELAEANEVLERERQALAQSKARTNELHKLGVDMERELTAMLEGIFEFDASKNDGWIVNGD